MSRMTLLTGVDRTILIFLSLMSEVTRLKGTKITGAMRGLERSDFFSVQHFLEYLLRFPKVLIVSLILDIIPRALLSLFSISPTCLLYCIFTYCTLTSL